MKELEPEVIEAEACVRSNRDFLMKGGAGSGKTHSMLSFLEQIYASDPAAKVACVTFTNVAVNEIRSRFPTTNLQVSTIHEFVWSLIGRFQKNVRESLAALVNDGTIKSSFVLPIEPDIWTEAITYKEWLSIESGEISHDELLKVAKHLFSAHPSLAKILIDRYDLLLIDEYQDTPVDVLVILLELLPDPNDRSLRIGLFGDSEQAIYEGEKGVDVVASAMNSGRLHAITKIQNRRNPSSVLRIINHLRSDDLTQVESTDESAPNFGKIGSARFLYTRQEELTTDSLRDLDYCKGWRFESDSTKLLYLGKSMIAREKQFPSLMAIYDKDRVVEYAKRLREGLAKKNILVDAGISLGQVRESHGDSFPPTPTQRKAFEQEPELLAVASTYSFEDIVTTSTSSDRLLGTKKVSELDDRDRGEKRDPLINHLIAIQEIRRQFRRGKFSAVIRAMDEEITSIDGRQEVANSLEALDAMDTSSVSEVITFAEDSGLLRRKDAVLRFQAKHPYRYNRVGAVPFAEVVNLYEYVEDHSPYSTQHSVKGSEWDNIFISLDNGGWNNYNFEKLLADPQGRTSVLDRSRMMLYVTCSRAKENLIVYVHKPAAGTLARAKDWFGIDAVECVG
ncbi:UvrD-helicase domain-containing protein [Microbacterium sp.]|uniref:UvrD-helicase domain-containing protein n=1 Tax=Microbacterium sp. TaxID=51671 RepID=UPI003F972398